MIDQTEKLRLVGSVLSMFRSAKKDKEIEALRVPVEEPEDTTLTPEQQEALREYREMLPVLPQPNLGAIPQACALLLSTSHVFGGVAGNPLTFLNTDADDVIKIAHQRLLDHKESNFPPKLKDDYHIVAIALTIVDDQESPHEDIIDLFGETLSNLPGLKAPHLMLVCPVTENVKYSQPLAEYGL